MWAILDRAAQSEFVQDPPGGGIEAVATYLVAGKARTVNEGHREACPHGCGSAAAAGRTGADDDEVVGRHELRVVSPMPGGVGFGVPDATVAVSDSHGSRTMPICSWQ